VLTRGYTAGGLSSDAHENLDTLVHKLAETSETELFYAGGDLTRLTVWQTAARLIKVREYILTYGAGDLTDAVITQHDEVGVVVQTLTKAFIYAGGDLVTVTTVET